MLNIRRGVFETNSSSTHSIAIQKETPELYPKKIYFGYDEYGWEFDMVDPADYLYTAILCLYKKDQVEEKCAHIRDVLSAIGVKSEFKRPKWKSWDLSDGSKYWYVDEAEIDHAGEASDFVEAILSDDDMLIRFVCGNSSFVATGNDNSDWAEESMCYSAIPMTEVWHDDNWEEKPNPNHNPEHFDYFFKGN